MSKDTKAVVVAIICGALIVAIGLVAAAGIDAYNSPYQNCLRGLDGATGFFPTPEANCVMIVYKK
jgi:hypothetical protein